MLVSLPDSDKREEKGNRPAIAVQTDVAVSPMLMIVPVTSSLGALRFPFTVRIEPSALNGCNYRFGVGICDFGDRCLKINLTSAILLLFQPSY